MINYWHYVDGNMSVRQRRQPGAAGVVKTNPEGDVWLDKPRRCAKTLRSSPTLSRALTRVALIVQGVEAHYDLVLARIKRELHGSRACSRRDARAPLTGPLRLVRALFLFFHSAWAAVVVWFADIFLSEY